MKIKTDLRGGYSSPKADSERPSNNPQEYCIQRPSSLLWPPSAITQTGNCVAAILE